MPTKIITTFFSKNGQPQTGLSPTIRIWEVMTVGNTLVVNNAAMLEIGDGFYKYAYTTYDYNKDYVIRADAGAGLPPSERYSVAGNESFQEDIVNSVWNKPGVDHLTAGTMGLYQNEIHADAQQILIDTTLALNLLNLLIKYEANRTKIDKIAKTLTVYDNDGTSIIKVFNLKDSTGAPSVTEIAERVPV